MDVLARVPLQRAQTGLTVRGGVVDEKLGIASDNGASAVRRGVLNDYRIWG